METVNMRYSQYKQRYADCSVVPGSFNESFRTVDVLIPEGRAVPSGVRGKHFHGYTLEVSENGKTYRYAVSAVSEENAIRSLQKDFPNAKIVPYTMFR